MPILLGVAASLLIGISDALGRAGARRANTVSHVSTAMLSGSVVAVAVSLFVGSEPLAKALIFGAISGIFISVALATLYRGMAEFSAAVVAPSSAVCAALVPFGWDLLQGAEPSQTALFGCAVAIVFLGLSTLTSDADPSSVSSEAGLTVDEWIDVGNGDDDYGDYDVDFVDEGEEFVVDEDEEFVVGESEDHEDVSEVFVDELDETSDRGQPWRPGRKLYGPLLGIAAGVLLGLGVIFIADTPSESGAWSVAGQRVIGFVTMAGLAAKQRVPVLLPANIRHIGMLSGLAGTAGIICLVLGFQLGGDLGLVAVAGSMSPAVVVLLATAFDGDKIRGLQILGIAGSIGGVSLIALGS